jgi:hypothetical protein
MPDRLSEPLPVIFPRSSVAVLGPVPERLAAVAATAGPALRGVLAAQCALDAALERLADASEVVMDWQPVATYLSGSENAFSQIAAPHSVFAFVSRYALQPALDALTTDLAAVVPGAELALTLEYDHESGYPDVAVRVSVPLDSDAQPALSPSRRVPHLAVLGGKGSRGVARDAWGDARRVAGDAWQRFACRADVPVAALGMMTFLLTWRTATDAETVAR